MVESKRCMHPTSGLPHNASHARKLDPFEYRIDNKVHPPHKWQLSLELDFTKKKVAILK